MIGVALIAFDRPHYLHRTLAALEQQTVPAEYHFWQDRVVNEYSGRLAGNSGMIDYCHTLWDKARLPDKYTHLGLLNQGIGLHQFEAIEWMVERYGRVMVVEDDVLLSPHWLRLADLALDSYPFVCPGFQKRGGDMDALWLHWGHWWAEAFTAAAWARVRPFYLEYIALIRGIDYIQRPHAAIKELFARHGWEHPATSQDAAKDMAIHAAGLRRVVPEVNRAIGIGKTGVHFTPGLFAKLGFDNQTPYVFDSDATRMGWNECISE
jgi:hypothetical protein